jgi:NADH dehydrogenase FAD-containing subunit
MRRGKMIAGKSSLQYQNFVHKILPKKGVAMMPGVTYKEIFDGGIVVNDSQGRQVTVRADNIVIAAGARPNDKLFKTLQEKHFGLYRIGDCLEPRNIRSAIVEGFEVARNL